MVLVTDTPRTSSKAVEADVLPGREGEDSSFLRGHGRAGIAPCRRTAARRRDGLVP